MQIYVYWALIGLGLAPWVMMIFWLPDPPPDSLARYLVVSLVAAAGALFGGVVSSFVSSNPMPGIVGALAGASAFVGVARNVGGRGTAA